MHVYQLKDLQAMSSALQYTIKNANSPLVKNYYREVLRKVKEDIAELHASVTKER